MKQRHARVRPKVFQQYAVQHLLCIVYVSKVKHIQQLRAVVFFLQVGQLFYALFGRLLLPRDIVRNTTVIDNSIFVDGRCQHKAFQTLAPA